VGETPLLPWRLPGGTKVHAVVQLIVEHMHEIDVLTLTLYISVSSHGSDQSHKRRKPTQNVTVDSWREFGELQEEKEKLQQKNEELQQQQDEYREQIRDLQQQLNGRVYVSPQRCYATGKGLEVAVVRRPTTVVMHAVDVDGRECNKPLGSLECELVSEANKAVVGCEVEKKNSQYEISYQPTHRGKHQLNIRVEGVHIGGSPFSLVVKTPAHLRQKDLLVVSSLMLSIVLVTLTSVKSPIQRLGSPIQIICGIAPPIGVAVRDSGEIVVVEYGNHCVSIFDQNGTKIRTFGSEGSARGQFKGPFGVTIDSAGNILIADGSNHRIQKFTAEGKFITAVGRKGSGHLEFDLPVDIGFNPTNKKVYICDCHGHRVQVLNENLTFSSSFGRVGFDNGELHYPMAVAFDSTGSVYVTSRANSRIQIFTPEGIFLRKFGREDSGVEELSYPTGISIDSNDIVYVTDQSNHRVSVFTRQGRLVQSFGNNGTRLGEFNQPCGIAVDKSGLVYVSDALNKRVQVFNSLG